jgi:hypothetical protein
MSWHGSLDGSRQRAPHAATHSCGSALVGDRFGARLLQIGFDRIRLLVQRPPRTADAALRLAAEQYVFCDECQHGRSEMGTVLPGLDTVPGLALWLLTTPAWTFWWD